MRAVIRLEDARSRGMNDARGCGNPQKSKFALKNRKARMKHVRFALSFACAFTSWYMYTNSSLKHSATAYSQSHCSAFRRARPNPDVRKPESLNNTFNANLFPSRAGSKRFYLCSYPKTGCSQWMHLLHYLLTGQKVNEGLKIHEHRHRWSTMLHFPKDTETLADPNIPRILIMRNPYDRVLSAYHDFLKRSPHLKNTSFHNYVTGYVIGAETDKQFADHRRPVSEGCNIWDHEMNSFNVHWDYILKLEEMWLWSRCLFSELNLLDVVSKGWPTHSGQLFAVPNLERSRLIDHIGPIIGDANWPSTLEFSIGHEGPKLMKWDVYTPELVRIVNRVFEVDFQIGRYALWDAYPSSVQDDV